jgi:hypothetical protein
MNQFIIIASIVAILWFLNIFWTKDKDRVAIKIKKDGKYHLQRMSNDAEQQVPILLKLLVFIIIAAILYMPLDYLLNRS